MYLPAFCRGSVEIIIARCTVVTLKVSWSCVYVHVYVYVWPWGHVHVHVPVSLLSRP